MHVSAPPAKRRGLALMFGWRRLRFTLGLSIALGVVLSLHHVPPWPHWKPTLPSALTCTLILGLVAMLVFGSLKQWPKRLPHWLERWMLQVARWSALFPG